MIVTTCGAAGTLPALVFTGRAGFLGDGAGVCPTATAQQSSAPANVVTRIIFRTFILLLPNSFRRKLISSLQRSL